MYGERRDRRKVVKVDLIGEKLLIALKFCDKNLN